MIEVASVSQMPVEHLHKSQQSTLRDHATFAGVGLHTGEAARIVINPAEANTGIVFRRWAQSAEDAGTGQALVNATIYCAPENVIRSNHGTTLANEAGLSVATVEHLLAALAILEIDNVVIDVFGCEIPILDGSACEFVSVLRQVGIRPQGEKRREIIITEPLEIVDGERRLVIKPSEKFRMSIEIDFGNCLIGKQSITLTLEDAADLERMAQARTFCRLSEVAPLQAAGLIRGGSTQNSLVVDGETLLDGVSLRDPQEFALHKGLDLLGDLYLLGMPIRGEIHAVRPGHDLNRQLALALSTRQEQDVLSATGA